MYYRVVFKYLKQQYVYFYFFLYFISAFVFLSSLCRGSISVHVPGIDYWVSSNSQRWYWYAFSVCHSSELFLSFFDPHELFTLYYMYRSTSNKFVTINQALREVDLWLGLIFDLNGLPRRPTLFWFWRELLIPTPSPQKKDLGYCWRRRR